MKLTKKSELVPKEENESVLEAEIIDEDVIQPIKSAINQDRIVFPLAYRIGKTVGAIGPFVLALFQNSKFMDESSSKVGRGMRKRCRKGRGASWMKK